MRNSGWCTGIVFCLIYQFREERRVTGRAKEKTQVTLKCLYCRLLNEVRQIAAALSESWLDNSSPGYSMLGIT